MSISDKIPQTEVRFRLGCGKGVARAAKSGAARDAKRGAERLC